jgi:ATP-binding cassette subfamily A (ABC1) protein 3
MQTAIGSIQSVCDRHAVYEVHFSCRTREDLVKVQKLMAGIPGSRMADDVATRFEIPITRDAPGNTGALSLPQLFDMLTANRDGDEEIEFTVEKGTLESVFLKVIRENNVCEEDMMVQRKWWQFCTK